MKRRVSVISMVLVFAVVATGWSWLKPAKPGLSMTDAASKYLASLDEKQLETSTMKYDSPKRVEWHFIPKDERKGLQIKHMNEAQRAAAHKLLESCLSKVGYEKATKIMELEKVLHELEGGKGRFARDTERYYYTVFGEPKNDGRWGLSIEGHHLSLNFVVDKGEVISSTPTFYAANPADVKKEVVGIAKGTRVLAKEELLAFELVNSLKDEQKKMAIIAEKAPKEIRAAGEPQPPKDEAVGLPVGAMTSEQTKLMRQIVGEYLNCVPNEVAKARRTKLVEAGPNKIRFAWAGPTKPGIGHYYRIQGPTFLIEFVNTQPDAAGNPANHIHCVWRDMAGDFALPVN